MCSSELTAENGGVYCFSDQSPKRKPAGSDAEMYIHGSKFLDPIQYPTDPT